MARWHDADSVRDVWQDAPRAGTELSDLLDLAADACWRYVHPEWPATEELPQEVPTRFRVAQLMQAKAVWQLPRTSTSEDGMGMAGYQARVYVFGYDIRRILVPLIYGEVVG